MGNMNKHTPGPWRVQKTSIKGCPIVVAGDGARNGFSLQINGDANAALIAAAPELSEALARLVRVASVELAGKRDDVIEQAKAVLAKAGKVGGV